MSSEHDLKSPAWERLRSRLEIVLYEYDPDGMGASAGAPPDEYADFAISLIRALRDRERDEPIRDAARGVVPGASVALIEEIEKAWSDFQAEA